MSSQNASRTGDDARADAKAPQRERGRARVAALLAAGGVEFAEKGYDAATMTAIAARAGASIGSLYQFFPTKDVLADALLETYLAALVGDFERLRADTPALDVAALAHRLSRALLVFRAAHPAFAQLVEAPGRSLPAAAGARQRIRAEIAAVLCAKAPSMKAAEAQVRAAVVQQLMKAAVAIHGEASFTHRTATIDELERLMKMYLDEAFGGAIGCGKFRAAKKAAARPG
jgi:AcrR family transcriptional regulator